MGENTLQWTENGNWKSIQKFILYFELNEIELQIKKHLNYIEVKKKIPWPSP
jgi:hypothetical protein